MTKLPQMGDSVKNGVRTGNTISSLKGYFKRLFHVGKAGVSPLVQERGRFEAEMREQFLKLREKGLGIKVFTL